MPRRAGGQRLTRRMSLYTRGNRLITLEGWLKGSNPEDGGVGIEELYGGVCDVGGGVDT